MCLPRPRRVFGQDLLATERAVSVPPSVRIAANISVYVADVVSILLVEGIVCDLAEALSPEDQAFFEVKSDALQKERVL